ncbi:14842_t:CDS:1, partial [Dentiscutata heterogama]
NSRYCSHGTAKYKLSNEASQTIRWKYFIHTNTSPQEFAPGDIIFISGKYVVENAEPCMTVAFASTIDTGKPECEFNIHDVPVCDPHGMFYVSVNRIPKDKEDFIYFDAECTKYNSVTGSSNIKMDMTILYPSKSTRFKYLVLLGANIKSENKYIISGFVKFSDSGKMIIEVTDIDYVKSTDFNYNIVESSSSTKSNTWSIIDIIADDIESQSTKNDKPVSSGARNNNTAFDSCETLKNKATVTIEDEHESFTKAGNNHQEKQSEQNKDKS